MSDINQKNIYQRMVEVQKVVTSVQKADLIKMFEGDKGYKAVSHDDVAAALHLPLANAGIFMLPIVDDFSVSEFDQVNQYGKSKHYYRTDIKISVKWINVDKPDDYILSNGAAFAIDSSDKSFSKAYSLALKIVLLKVHLLESRDDEEKRILENDTELPQEPAKTYGASSGGQGFAGDNKQQPKNYAPKALPQTKAADKSAPKPQDKPKDPHPDVEPQKFPKDDTEPMKDNDPANYVVNIGAKLDGKKLSQISEKDLRQMSTWIDDQLKKTPPPKNIAALFDLKTCIGLFFKSVDVKF